MNENFLKKTSLTLPTLPGLLSINALSMAMFVLTLPNIARKNGNVSQTLPDLSILSINAPGNVGNVGDVCEKNKLNIAKIQTLPSLPK